MDKRRRVEVRINLLGYFDSSPKISHRRDDYLRKIIVLHGVLDPKKLGDSNKPWESAIQSRYRAAESVFRRTKCASNFRAVEESGTRCLD